MLKFYKSFLLLGITLLGLLAMGFAESLEVTSLKVVMDDNYPPFVFYDHDKNLQGILVDEWRLFEEKTGIKVTIDAMNWADALAQMDAGYYDVIDTIFINPKREEKYAFTKPYVDIDVSIYFHKNITGINTIDSVKGFAVAAKRGDQAVNVLKEAGVDTITLYDSYESIIKAAFNNEVVVFVIDNPPANHFLYKYGLQESFNNTTALYTGQFHRAVSIDHPELIPLIENGFDLFTPEEKQALKDKWYGKTSLLSKSSTMYLAFSFLGVMALLVGALVWNATLRRVVHEKTSHIMKANEELAYNQSKLSAVVESMPDWVFILNKSGHIKDFLSSRDQESLFVQPHDFIGKHLGTFFDQDTTKRFVMAIESTLLSNQPETVEYTILASKKHYYEARFIRLNDEESLSVVRNITALKEYQNTILTLSIMDTPTGVYNRNYFETQLKDIKNHPLDGLSFLMVDFDGLKLINDTQGHKAGDYYLKTVADLLKEAFDQAEFVARIGGDEFIVVLRDWTEAQVLDTKKAIKKRIALLNKDEKTIPFSISIGFCTYSPETTTVEEMLKCADDYMYREKLFHRQSAKSKNIEVLTTMLAERDFITEGHADRMSGLIIKLAKALGVASKDIESLGLFAHFHDIGKIGISDTLLFKAGKLDEKEFNEMKRHTEIGYRIAESSPDLMHISEWIYKHHEWWNGKGYPFGLKGNDIPLACRILTLVDAFDAMTNDRPYRKAMSTEEAIKEIKRCSGTQFDPDLVTVFVRLLQEEGKEV